MYQVLQLRFEVDVLLFVIKKVKILEIVFIGREREREREREIQ